MKVFYKIIFAISIVSMTALLIKYYCERNLLQTEYTEVLMQQETEFIHKFYKSSISGVISSIKEYETNSAQYVVSVVDSTNNESTIGKVTITNFANVKEGDSITKKSNSFELEIHGKEGIIKSHIKFK
jgi:hypothetical protein